MKLGKVICHSLRIAKQKEEQAAEGGVTKSNIMHFDRQQL